MGSHMDAAYADQFDDQYTAVVATITARELAHDLAVAEQNASAQHARNASLSTKLTSIKLAYDETITELKTSKTAEETTARSVAALQVQVDDLVVRFDALKISQRVTLTRMQEHLAVAREETIQQRGAAELAVQEQDRVKDLLIFETDRVKSLEMEKEEIVAQKRLIQVDLTELEQRVGTLTDGLQREKADTSRLEEEKQAAVHQHGEKCENYEAVAETSRVQLNEAKGDLSRFMDRVHLLQAETQALNYRLLAAESTNLQLEGQLLAAEKQRSTLSDNLDSSEQTLNDVQSEVQRLSSDLETQVATSSERDRIVSHLNSENTTLRRANTTLLADVSKAKRSSPQWHAEVRNLQQELQERLSHAEAMAADHLAATENMTSINVTHEETISRLERMRHGLDVALRDAQEENRGSRQRLHVSGLRQKQLEADVDRLQVHNTDLVAQYVKAEAIAKASYRAKLDEACSTISKLQHKVSKLKEEKLDLHEEVKELTKEVASSKHRKRASRSGPPTIPGFNDSDGEMNPAVLGRSYRVRSTQNSHTATMNAANEQNGVKVVNQDYGTQTNTMTDRMLLNDVARVEQEMAVRTLCLTTLSASSMADHSEQIATLPPGSSVEDDGQGPSNTTSLQDKVDNMVVQLDSLMLDQEACSYKIQSQLVKAQTEALDQRQIAEATVMECDSIRAALSKTREEAGVVSSKAEAEGVRNDALEIANDKLTRKVVELQDREVMHYRMLQAASQTIAGLEGIVRCNNIYTGPASSVKYRVSASQQSK
ncbi:hypothetical protein LTS10_009428 [Elasticomyces elasticus]|nr:hypothetical protein LTS10_009428 [Elasticomyces elasticus]